MSEYVEFTNEHGHRIQMSREDYRKKVIPHNLHLYWDDKEKLRQFAMELVRDRFTEEAAQAADRLLELFGPIEAALIFRAVVHMQAQEMESAKKILHLCMERFPSSGQAYTNLAKIMAFEGSMEKAMELLEAGLVKDPNQEHGLEWYVELLTEQNRKDEITHKLKALGEREGAWLPQLILGRLALKEENLLLAMESFQTALERVEGREDIVINVTGELGKAGYLYQLIQIAEKYFRPDFVFPYVAFNYANALIATEQPEKALEVLLSIREHVHEEYRPAVEEFIKKLSPALKDAPQPTEETAKDSQKKPWWKVW